MNFAKKYPFIQISNPTITEMHAKIQMYVVSGRLKRLLLQLPTHQSLPTLAPCPSTMKKNIKKVNNPPAPVKNLK